MGEPPGLKFKNMETNQWLDESPDGLTGSRRNQEFENLTDEEFPGLDGFCQIPSVSCPTHPGGTAFGSMIEEEFLGVEGRPDHVLKCLTARG